MNAPKSAPLTVTSCWSCSTPLSATPFCPTCGKIQPTADTATHFDLLQLPRKLWLAMEILEQKFLQLSWKLHPDNFVNKDAREKEISLQLSSKLNDAHRVLRDPVARVEYLLELEGIRKEGQHKQQAPPELLEEVFELNESLDELRDAKSTGSDLSILESRLDCAQTNFKQKLSAIDAEMQTAAKQWDAALDSNASDSDKEAILQRLNELLNRRSYVRNLVDGVQKELSEAASDVPPVELPKDLPGAGS